MKKALITGANKSTGLETARQLLQQGYYVYMGSRSLENGNEAVEKLKAEGFNHAEAVQLDVTDETSVKAARASIGANWDSTNVLVNNDGILGGMEQAPAQASLALYKVVSETDLFGAVLMNQTFVDLLLKSEAPLLKEIR
jgi:NAD(P)-dependent dehydrogenase (short-subunit alcohol dehydrogenase family)